MDDKDFEVVPADRRPESIASVLCVVTLESSNTHGGLSVRTTQLVGTIEEKLAKYKEIFGHDWPGTNASVIRTYKPPVISNAPVIDMKQQGVKVPNPHTAETQKKINELVKEARQYLKENEKAKKLSPVRISK